MRMAVFSQKPCWSSDESPCGLATDGGFPFQMKALSELFDSTCLVVPCYPNQSRAGEIPLNGNNLAAAPLAPPYGKGVWRKLTFPVWAIFNSRTLIREFRHADAIYADIPGDIGTLGMLLAYVFSKPLLVRHCGNWLVQRTAAEKFWKWFMERSAGGQNVMLATGGGLDSPSTRNKAIRWIFATSLTEEELKQTAQHRQQPVNRLGLAIACRQDIEKGTNLVIQSLPLILKNFPGAVLHVAGDGKALASLKQLAAETRVADRVEFHGKINHEQVLQMFRQADIFCYPTAASEGFPKVVLEALASGLPVITTRVSVLPQLMNSGCGVLMEERTPAAVAAAVQRVVADADAYCRMSALAVETASTYSLERWRNAIGSMLQNAWGPLRSNA